MEFRDGENFLKVLEEKKTAVEEAVEPFETARNKIIAHNDKAAWEDNPMDGLGYSIEDVREVIGAVTEYRKVFYSGACQTSYREGFGGETDVTEFFDALISYADS
jgi:hypothetical protein